MLCKRTVDWLRNNSEIMMGSLGETGAMCRPEFYSPDLTDEEIWRRWTYDNISGLVNYYFKDYFKDLTKANKW